MMLSLSLTQPSAQEPTTQGHPTIATGFLYKTLTIDKETYAYGVYVPPDYTPDKPWPVILFLHGSGERGDDGFLQTEVGIGRAIRRNYRVIPAIVIMPQCRPNQDWVGPMSQLALRCIEQTSREFHLDPDRIYLTGLSLGGQGAWHLAARMPGRFAAVVPICGFAEWGPSTGLAAKLAEKLTNVPIWCFHGDEDKAVPVAAAREMVEAVRQAGGTIYYTEVKGGGHNVWDHAYDNLELWRWLFSQKRGTPTSAPTSAPADSGQ
jgi:predicted peptidase